MIDAGDLVKLFNLPTNFFAILDACEHDTLRNGAQYLLELVSLLPKLNLLRHTALVSNHDVFCELEIGCKTNPNVWKDN